MVVVIIENPMAFTYILIFETWVQPPRLLTKYRDTIWISERDWRTTERARKELLSFMAERIGGTEDRRK